MFDTFPGQGLSRRHGSKKVKENAIVSRSTFHSFLFLIHGEFFCCYAAASHHLILDAAVQSTTVFLGMLLSSSAQKDFEVLVTQSLIVASCWWISIGVML